MIFWLKKRALSFLLVCTGNHRFLVITSAGIPLARKTGKFVYLMRGSLLKNSLHANLLQIVFMCLNHCIYVFKFELFLDWQGYWLKVENLIKFDQAVMMFKINNQLCPESLWNKFRQRYEISNYNTRNCRNLEIPKTNLEKTKKGFHYTGLQVWNSIPNEIRELPLLHQFKNNLKKRFYRA